MNIKPSQQVLINFATAALQGAHMPGGIPGETADEAWRIAIEAMHQMPAATREALAHADQMWEATHRG